MLLHLPACSARYTHNQTRAHKVVEMYGTLPLPALPPSLRTALMGTEAEINTGLPLYGVQTHTCAGESRFGCRTSKNLCFPHTSPTAAADLPPPKAEDDAKPSRLHVPLL